MNAKTYLRQVEVLDHRIDSKIAILGNLKEMATKTTSIMSDVVVCRTRNTHSMEDVIVKIVDMQEQINRDIDRLVDLKREIMDVLDEVKDMNFRLILEKRYLCFESWPKIGEDMGHSDRWAQLKHQAALRVVQQILDKRAA